MQPLYVYYASEPRETIWSIYCNTEQISAMLIRSTNAMDILKIKV